MEYLEIVDSDQYRLIKLARGSQIHRIGFVREFEEALKTNEKEFAFLDLRDVGYTQPKALDEEYRESSFHLRRLLSELIYHDKIYISMISGDILDQYTELIFSTDYLLYIDNPTVRFTDKYYPLNSGLAYILFRGGTKLLNKLYIGIKSSALVEDGIIEGEPYNGEDFDAIVKRLKNKNLIGRKAIYREIFVRDFHHYISIEDAMMDRLLYIKRFK